MFDPTAFENMRVVMEGGFYDRDLNGEIAIIDRNDCINSAKLSRTYDLSFQLALPNRNVTCRFSLLAGLDNLAAELMPSIQANNLAGCFVTIEFIFEDVYKQSLMSEVETILNQIWGENRTIKLTFCSEPLCPEQKGEYKAKVLFDRMITEDQIDDLAMMTDYMLLTTERIEKAL
ncbi:hypothetical protein [Niallia endozanthoxylica]|uniref:Uncharacterized protein n=1 Tax=Niallia endozanthoxylica TaxID=2036016 RepID=A0A5J5HQA5_9BACI|nr:hypothetical protein [Niallia endozanthoxylica]KAA9021679.1 hypothetical protein F4V44_16985 [Niallia endozanthoxylica]